MNEPLEPPELDPADLAASTALDGETEPLPGQPDGPDHPDAAAPPDDARVAAAHAEFQSLRTAIGGDLTLPADDIRDAQLAAAVAAAISEPEVAPTTAIAPVTSLASRRGPARRRWLAAAAAVAVVALAVPFVNALRHGSSSTSERASSSSAASDTAVAASAADGGVLTPQPAAGVPSTLSSADATGQDPGAVSTTSLASPTTPADLGDASSPAELASLVEAADPALATSPWTPTSTSPDGSAPTTTNGATATAAASACDGTVRSLHAGLGDLVLVTTARVGGTPVEVLVYADASGGGAGYRLVAVTPADCRVVVDQLL